MTEPPQELVARGYDAVAERYAALEKDVAWPRLRWLDDLLGRLPEGAHVLEPRVWKRAAGRGSHHATAPPYRG